MPKKTAINPGKLEETGYLGDEEKGTKKQKPRPPIDEEKVLAEFKTDFKKHLGESAKKRVTYPTSKINRRLDSLARLIEGKNICTAVTFDAQNKKILIAANTIFSGSKGTNLYIQFIEKTMVLLLNHNLSVNEVLRKLSDLLSTNLAQEERFSVEGLKKELKLTSEDFTQIINDLLLDQFKSGQATKKWRDNISDCQFENENIERIKDKPFFSKLVKKISRIARDFLKLRQLLFVEHNTFSLGQTEVIKAIKNPQQHEIVRTERNDVHVEMRLLAERTARNNLDGSYIGISKLCCDHCGLAVETTNPWEEVQKITRGKHGQGPRKWPLPTFLQQDKELLKTYMGKSAYQAFQQLPKLKQQEALQFIESSQSSPTKMGKRSMQADSSDSDETLGFSCSEEEIEECLEKISLNEVWLFRKIKRDYKDELLALLRLEVPLSDIFSFYKTSPDKLAKLGSAGVITLLQDIEENERSDILEQLSETYDENQAMFDDVIADSENLIEEYGLTEVLDTYRYFLNRAKHYQNNEDAPDFYTLTANRLQKDREPFHYNSDDSQNIVTDSEKSSHSSDNNSDQEEPEDSEREYSGYSSP